MPARPPLIVVTGPSGAGKSTLCLRLVDACRQTGLGVAGVATVRRAEAEGATAGLDVIDLATDRRVPLAERDAPADGPVTGRWRFHQAAFDVSLAWCRQAPPGALLIVDEFGPLELVQGAGWAPLLPIVREHEGPAVAVVRPSLIATFGRLAGDRALRVFTVEPAGRETVWRDLLRALVVGP